MSKLDKFVKLSKQPVVSGIVNVSIIACCFVEVVNKTSNIWLMLILIIYLIYDFQEDYFDHIKNK